ncbi:MAG: hypothetical protein C4B59_17020, partial [Candidatus Methanogaster sp.]
VEDVLLKSRMREIFKSGSVRGRIVTSGLLPRKEVRYVPYLTVVIFILRPLCVTLWFSETLFRNGETIKLPWCYVAPGWYP